MEFIKRTFTKMDKVVGLELLLGNDYNEWRMITLIREKKFVKFDQKKIIKSTDVPLDAEWDKNIPLSIVINGKGIVHKRVKNLNVPDEELLSGVIPNINSNDFYFQKTYTDETQGYVSLVRKNILDPILKQLKVQGFMLVDLRFGPYVFDAFYNYLDLKGNDFEVSEWVVSYVNGRMDSFVPNKDSLSYTPVTADQERIDKEMILAHSAAINTITRHDLRSSSHNVNDVYAAKEDYQYKLIYKKGILAALIFLFCILLLNFILFTHYSTKNEQLSSYKFVSEKENQSMAALKGDIEKQKRFLSEIGWIGQSNISFSIDKIASTVPDQILLNELSFNPVDIPNSRVLRRSSFITGIIKISGNCNYPTDLNVWIGELKKIEWIKGVQVIRYNYDHSKKRGDFNIEIDY